jgi:hypothetical protein
LNRSRLFNKQKDDKKAQVKEAIRLRAEKANEEIRTFAENRAGACGAGAGTGDQQRAETNVERVIPPALTVGHLYHESSQLAEGEQDVTFYSFLFLAELERYIYI